ncbi:RiPP maturation radical SAM protein 1 [Streptomyces sp. I6]|nr:RiPP maturation radical SAM protein 1 [Streptomyces sp. I6]
MLKLVGQPLFPPDCVPARPLRIGLVNMPWARTDTPSIQCGLLQAALGSFGHDARSVYPNLELSAVLGTDLYDLITEAPSERVHLFGEWLFGTAAFGVTEDVEDYRRRFPEVAEMCAGAGLDWDAVADLRCRRLPSWIDELAARSIWSDLDIVGFTSTFIQNVAALALARRLKEARPEVVVVFGGANYDGDMGPEYLRNFGFIDYVVVGEGDVTLPRLAAAVARGADPARIPGVCGRTPDGRVTTPVPGTRTRDMDQLPVPDYRDYFTALEALGRDRVIGRNTQRLLVEFSRGCWWGAKHHCTFCGLNALGMQYRAKSPARALSELEELMRRHRVLAVDAVDNILDMAYLGTFCAGLRGSVWDTALFFEVKANLTRDQVRLLAEAGCGRSSRAGEPQQPCPRSDAQGVLTAPQHPPAQVGPLLRRPRRLEPPRRIPRRDRRGLHGPGRPRAPAHPPGAARRRGTHLARAVQPVLHRPLLRDERGHAEDRLPAGLPGPGDGPQPDRVLLRLPGAGRRLAGRRRRARQGGGGVGARLGLGGPSRPRLPARARLAHPLRHPGRAAPQDHSRRVAGAGVRAVRRHPAQRRPRPPGAGRAGRRRGLRAGGAGRGLRAGGTGRGGGVPRVLRRARHLPGGGRQVFLPRPAAAVRAARACGGAGGAGR